MTLNQCVNAYHAVNKMMEVPLDFQSAYAFVQLKRALLEHVQFFQEKEIELVRAYAKLNEAGEIEWSKPGHFAFRDAESVRAYNDKMKQLCAVCVQWSHSPAQVIAPNQISPSILEALDGFVEFTDTLIPSVDRRE